MVVLALAIGVAAGLIIRRTVPAMAVTLAVVAIQVTAPMLLQQHLLPADRTISTIRADNLRGLMLGGDPDTEPTTVVELQVRVDSPGAWVTDNVTLDRPAPSPTPSRSGSSSAPACRGGSPR